MIIVVENRVPTRLSSAVFACKAALLKLRRLTQDVHNGVRPCPYGAARDYPHILAESRTPLWIEESVAERGLQQGKVENLRRALSRLNGTAIPADGLFSFWQQIGKATRRRGYVLGRQLRDGCLYPAVGGGLCQLSNALYDISLRTGCEIVERHPHTHIVPGSSAQGRDATVAWNYIDLRFRPAQPLLIEARLTQSELIVRLRSQIPPVPNAADAPSRHVASIPLHSAPPKDTRPILDIAAHSCATCGVEACFRHDTPTRRTGRADGHTIGTDARTAYLVDACQPEFRRYLVANHMPHDVLAIPLDGTHWRQPRYGWETTGYAHVGTATWQTLGRSLAARQLRERGAQRLQAQLAGAETLARRLTRELRPAVTRGCIAQSLLPFVWREGHLGGRRFEVLMTGLPLQTLHARLDAALAAHPERHTLGEFRAPAWIVEAESEALAAAEQIVTPHATVAALFPGRATLLEWQLPAGHPFTPGTALAFPGPTAARKGAYELRAIARALDLEIILLGGELEGDAFWQGVRTRRVLPGAKQGGIKDWRNGIAAVVQPALIEERPSALLAALAAGIPVIATPACGLGARPGVITVPFGDETALEAAICSVLSAGQATESCTRA
jgi:hypothetical protein